MEKTLNRALTRSQGWADRLYTAIVMIIALGMLLVVGYPLYNVVINSISDPLAVMQGRVLLWPIGTTLEAYSAVINYPNIWLGYGNSLYYTVFGTLINLVFTVLAAYPLARRDLYGRNALTFLFSFTMFFSGGMIPTYMVIMKLGMLNTRWAMLIPGALSVWNVILMRTFFQSTVPEELYEATLLDGGNDFHYLVRVVLPLSKAIIAVLSLYYAVGHWNSYFSALIYLNKTEDYPLQIFLRRILVMNEVDVDMMGTVNVTELAELSRRKELLKYALIIVSSLPVMMLYPFVQRYFVQGVMIGSIKG